MKKILLFISGFVLLFSLSSFAIYGKTAVLKISTKGGQLYFDKEKLSAKTGQHVKLIFHNGSPKGSGLQHDWVLVKPGTADQVAAASLTAGVAKGWIADSPDVIAHAKLINPEESEVVEFNAPIEPGDYPYICTFPGHSQTMRGIFHVEK